MVYKTSQSAPVDDATPGEGFVDADAAGVEDATSCAIVSETADGLVKIAVLASGVGCGASIGLGVSNAKDELAVPVGEGLETDGDGVKVGDGTGAGEIVGVSNAGDGDVLVATSGVTAGEEKSVGPDTGLGLDVIPGDAVCVTADVLLASKANAEGNRK